MGWVVTNVGGSANKSATGTVSIAGTITIPAGSLIIVGVSTNKNRGVSATFTTTSPAISDTAGNTWRYQSGANSTNVWGYFYYCYNSTAITAGQINYTCSATESFSADVWYATGELTPGDPLDTAATPANGSSAAPAVTISSGTSNALYIYTLATNGPSGDSFTQDAGSGFLGGSTGSPPPQRFGTIGAGGTTNYTITGGQVTGGIGSATPSPTITSRAWVMCGATFKVGNTVAVDVSEAGSSADTKTVILGTVAEAISEAGSASDAGAAQAALAVSEAGSASDAESITFLAPVAITESGAAANTVTITLSTVALSVSEAGTGTDTATVSIVFPLSVSEAGTAADAESVAALAVLSISEAGSAANTIATAMAGSLNASEAGSGADAVSVGARGAVGVAEAGSAADAETVTARGSLAVSEAGSAADVVALGVVFALAVDESGVALDAVALLDSEMLYVAEMGDALDTVEVTVSGGKVLIDGHDGADEKRRHRKSRQDAERARRDNELSLREAIDAAADPFRDVPEIAEALEVVAVIAKAEEAKPAVMAWQPNRLKVFTDALERLRTETERAIEEDEADIEMLLLA